MERVIDRKEYRRNNEKEKVIEDEQIDIIQQKIKKILLQLLGVSIILLFVSFLKFYNKKDVLNKISSALNNQITISSLQKNGQRIYEIANNYYVKLDAFIETVFNYNRNTMLPNLNKKQLNLLHQTSNSGEDVSVLNSNLNNMVSGDSLLNSNNLLYESAVEGINQMSEDSKYIKENYKITIPVIGTITSEFGVRESQNPMVSSYHSGLDIAANTGTQILAALDGEVIEATTDTYYGKYLKIKKDDIVIIYAHCSKLLVKVGDKVKKGELIAYVGNTGNSTGPHLHFELRYQDRLVNPRDIFEI